MRATGKGELNIDVGSLTVSWQLGLIVTSLELCIQNSRYFKAAAAADRNGSCIRTNPTGHDS